MLKIENDNSTWKFWYLFKITVKRIKDLGKGYSIDKNSIIDIEKTLIRFLERIPSGDYSNLREEWDKR